MGFCVAAKLYASSSTCKLVRMLDVNKLENITAIILVTTFSSRGRALTSSGNRGNHSYFYNVA